ncbi:hypothetical protein F511_17813 [Dorcoceras hygrometricum]|uniref:Uncharacterized protein n=1 Tax=Dorcoceras hygrometricum TaxID=472368 RepID=A0A2Z7CNS8_9LAMI|nr:hypothetical protein F511_17813 [Dorcoceras hygrometricum]
MRQSVVHRPATIVRAALPSGRHRSSNRAASARQEARQHRTTSAHPAGTTSPEHHWPAAATMKITRCARPRTAATSAAHDAGCANRWPEQVRRGGGGGEALEEKAAVSSTLGSRTPQNPPQVLNTLSPVSVRESRIQYFCDPQWFGDTASRITDSACKNQLVVVSVQYGPFNPYIPIRSTTIGKSRVAKDPIAMHTSWRSNSDIASVTRIGYPRMSASGESSTTMHRLLHASESHPIPPPNDPNIGYPRMSASGESSTTMHRLLHASRSHPIPPPNDPNDTLATVHRSLSSPIAGGRRLRLEQEW